MKRIHNRTGHVLLIAYKNSTAALPQLGQCGCCDRALTAFQQERKNILQRNAVFCICANYKLAVSDRDIGGILNQDIPECPDDSLPVNVCLVSRLTGWYSPKTSTVYFSRASSVLIPRLLIL